MQESWQLETVQRAAGELVSCRLERQGLLVYRAAVGRSQALRTSILFWHDDPSHPLSALPFFHLLRSSHDSIYGSFWACSLDLQPLFVLQPALQSCTKPPRQALAAHRRFCWPLSEQPAIRTVLLEGQRRYKPRSELCSVGTSLLNHLFMTPIASDVVHVSSGPLPLNEADMASVRAAE
ncbi:hypothetical protein VTN00DRAFT_3750 [Thermoascus crustaceus]|uniref:uncharacterized protein n=1 Tax=Thermoascus crustaceus TaxID=5088 RepID=UPI003742E163